MNKKKNNFVRKYLNYLDCNINYEAKVTKCEICSSSKYSSIIDVISWGQKNYGYMPIVTCNFCGFVFQLFRFSRKFYEKFYSKYYRIKIFSNTKPSRELVLDQKNRGKKLFNFLKTNKLIENNGNMLDVGCGVGLFLKPFMELGWKCFGNDPDKMYVNYGIKKFNLPIKYEQAEDMKLKKKSLDLIIIMGSLEHCYDPNVIMKKCSLAAKNNCILVLEARGNPQSDSKNYFNHNHHRYFSKNSLELIMIKHDFKPIISTDFPITGPTRKGGIYTIGIKQKNKTDIKRLIKMGKRETPMSIIYKHKYYNKILKEKY